MEARPISHRTHGSQHGPITRLVSPGDLGRILKPFVFVDYFHAPNGFEGGGFGWHPHSGIATITVLLEGSAWARETVGERHPLQSGDVEFMRAGGGVWHTGGSEGTGGQRGVQLWVSLPPQLENAPARSDYIHAGQIPSVGGARVIAGTYQGVRGPIQEPEDIALLDVSLENGTWTFEGIDQHNVLWLLPTIGTVTVDGERVDHGELVILRPGATVLQAEGSARVLLGSGIRRQHPLVLGPYSVHTSRDALRKGHERIVEIGRELSAAGMI
ncbi:MAG: pirin family protein [Myxococcota bacterium]|nr:pirin family protein [Myxococcota bacterium]